MLHKPGVTESLARHIAATRWGDIPSRVRHQAKRSLVNFFAVTLAGCRSRPVETALRSLSEFSGGKQVALIGRKERIDALSAAFLNAAGANVDDFCDTHTATVIHPTAPVAGALFSHAGLRQRRRALRLERLPRLHRGEPRRRGVAFRRSPPHLSELRLSELRLSVLRR